MSAHQRFKECAVVLRDGKILPGDDLDSPMASFIPNLDVGEEGSSISSMALLSLLAHHIATPSKSKYSKAGVEHIIHLYNELIFIFHQNSEATSFTDPASMRIGCGVHTFTSTKWGNKPICEDTDPNRKFIKSLLNAFLQYGAETLGVPKENLVLTRIDIRGYDIGAFLGKHPDTPNSLDPVLSRLRLFLKTGASTKIVWTLHEYNSKGEGGPVTMKDENGRSLPSFELICEEGFMVYASSAFGSGHIPLARNGNTFFIPYHEVKRVEGGRAITWVIDYYFNSVKDTMVALEKIRKNVFHLDFSGTKYADEYLYNNVSVSCQCILVLICRALTPPSSSVLSCLIQNNDRKRKSSDMN